jgi:hypothetical protein
MCLCHYFWWVAVYNHNSRSDIASSGLLDNGREYKDRVAAVSRELHAIRLYLKPLALASVKPILEAPELYLLYGKL